MDWLAQALLQCDCMWCIPTCLGAAAFAAVLALSPGQASAQEGGGGSPGLRRALMEFTQLRADLDRVNADVATLKREDRSVRTDYRLRDRMADAEALAQRVTQAENRLRALGWSGATPTTIPMTAPPQAMPQDGSLELEAKAGLFADQAKKLDGEATLLAKAADELRNRKALRRRAGAWDRDPFVGLEASKRSLVVSATTIKSLGISSPSGDASTRSGGGTASSSSGASVTSGSNGAMVPGSAAPPPTLALPTATVSDGTGKEATGPSAAPESASASKTSPMPQTAGQDRPFFEQRLYLDPATAAELRHVFDTGGIPSDSEALDRAAAALRARARALSAQAQALLAKSRAP